MSRFSATELIARVGALIIERFHGLGAVDFRLWPQVADRLHISVHFREDRDHAPDLAALRGLVEGAGVPIETERADARSIAVEIALCSPLREPVVVPLHERLAQAR